MGGNWYHLNLLTPKRVIGRETVDSASGAASPVLTGYGRSVGSLGPGLTSDSADAVRAVLRDDLSAPVQEGTSRMEERPAWMRDGAKALLLEGAVTYRSSASRSTRTTYGAGWRTPRRAGARGDHSRPGSRGRQSLRQKCDSGLGRVRLSPTRPWIS